MQFRMDVFAWIPQAEVPNPIHALPGGTARWGPGACGPHFGGDNFVTPPATYSGWARTFRAKQSLGFQVSTFGDPPSVTINTGVRPGTTTVLTAPRAAGGTICHSITATVKTSTASVAWQASDGWYEAKMHGEAQDPVPAAVAGGVAGAPGAAVASAFTPNLEWDLNIRFQRGTSIPFLTKARYTVSAGLNLDVSGSRFPTPAHFGGTANLVHGTITVRRFPSYVLYVTIDSGSGATTIPYYFADASGRNLATIAIGQTDPLRQLTW